MKTKLKGQSQTMFTDVVNEAENTYNISYSEYQAQKKLGNETSVHKIDWKKQKIIGSIRNKFRRLIFFLSGFSFTNVHDP